MTIKYLLLLKIMMTDFSWLEEEKLELLQSNCLDPQVHFKFDLLLFSVNKLKQETDVVINIPDNDKGSTEIRIEGNKEGVKKAKEVGSSSFSCTRASIGTGA